MIIDRIPYAHQMSDLLCSTSASLYMILRYYGETITPEEVAESYWDTVRMGQFRARMFFSHEAVNTERVSLYCASEYLETRGYKTSLFRIETAKIFLTYIKRRIPVIVAGRFPVIGGRVSNTVVIKGYVGDFAVVNDPKGNALTYYTDRFGENMIYPIRLLEEWVGTTTEIVRVVND